MKPKTLFWFLFVCVIPPPLCAQQDQKLIGHKSFKSILILLLLLLPTISSSQWSKEVDSLIRTAKQLPEDPKKVARYGTLFEKLMFTDSDRALAFAKLEHSLAIKINFKKGIATSAMHFGTYHENIGQMDSARYYYQDASKKYEEINSAKGELFINHAQASLEKKLGNYNRALTYHEANIGIYERPDIETTDLKGFNKIGAEYQGLAEIYKEKGNYKLAVEQALKALRFFEEIEHTRRIGNALQELGAIEYLRKNYREAIAYAEKAYAIYKDHDYHEYRGLTANDLGRSFMAIRNYEKAISHFEDALQIGRDHKFADVEASALTQLGVAKRIMKEYKSAEIFLSQALALHKTSGFKKEQSENLNELAKLSLDIKQPSVAIGHASQSLILSKEIGSLQDQSDAYFIRSRAYEANNRKDLSFDDFKIYAQLKDSIFNTTKSQQIEELRTIYDTEKKEQQIALQERNIKVLEQEASISNLQRLLMAIGLLLSVLGIYALRQKMKRNKLEKEKVEAELAFKKKELTTHALNLARKNETLENLKLKAQELKEKENIGVGYNQLIRSINFDLQDDNNWQNFSRYFEEVHKDFNSIVKSKYPQVTSNELRLLALLKMNLSSKEIASILNISPEGIKKARYRLRKKLSLSTEDSLQDLVLSL
ncbi:MAG: tetratricopeptide repeat protein [Maribacter sp.]